MHGAGHGGWAWVIIRGAAGGLFRLALSYGRSMKRNRNLINYSSQEYVQNNFLVKLYIFLSSIVRGASFLNTFYLILSYLILSFDINLSPNFKLKQNSKIR